MGKGGKRGQVTFFIVLGVVILFSIIIYALLRTGMQREITPHLQATTLAACTEEALEEIFFDIPFYGGYNVQAEKFIPTLFGNIAVYFHKQIMVPSQEQVQKSLENAAKERVVKCMEIERSFRKEIGEITVNIVLSSEDTRAIVTYPGVLVHDNNEQKAPPIAVRSKARILALYTLANRITHAIASDPLRVPSSDLLAMEEKEHVAIDTIFGDQNVMYFITDTADDAMQLTWAFAVRQ